MPSAGRVQLGRRATSDETGNELLNRALDRDRGSPELRLAAPRPSQFHGTLDMPGNLVALARQILCCIPVGGDPAGVRSSCLVADPGTLQEQRNKGNYWE